MGLERERARDSAQAEGEAGTASRARRRALGLAQAGGPTPASVVNGTPERARERAGPARAQGRQSRGLWRTGAGSRGRGARRPTDLLTDRRRHAPLHPAPPRPAPPPQLALCLYLPHFFSTSASFGLPWRQSLPLAQAGAWTVCRALVESGGRISCSGEPAPWLGDRCRGSFWPVDQGMRRVRPGTVAFGNSFSVSRPPWYWPVVPRCPTRSSCSRRVNRASVVFT